jgi:hypothetical protein
MTFWRSRIFTALLFLAVMKMHEYATSDLENSPVGMLMFHGSAWMVDLFLLCSVPALLAGRLCDDMQALCLASIAVNFVGWILYMAYAPPVFYNMIQWSLAYVQWLRLFMVDGSYDHFLGLHMVLRGAGRRHPTNY